MRGEAKVYISSLLFVRVCCVTLVELYDEQT